MIKITRKQSVVWNVPWIIAMQTSQITMYVNHDKALKIAKVNVFKTISKVNNFLSLGLRGIHPQAWTHPHYQPHGIIKEKLEMRLNWNRSWRIQMAIGWLIIDSIDLNSSTGRHLASFMIWYYENLSLIYTANRSIRKLHTNIYENHI